MSDTKGKDFAPAPLVVTDVDLTIWCGGYNYRHGACGCEIVGNDKVIYELDDLHAAGHDVALWSGSGSAHCKAVAEAVGLTYARWYADKPDGLLTAHKAEQMFGVVPVHQFDDDIREKIDDPRVTFHLVEGYNPHNYVLSRWEPVVEIP